MKQRLENTWERATSDRPTPTVCTQLWNSGAQCPYDEIVDVRSPIEFAEDRIPGAMNLPVLSDEERAEVGTLYRIEGGFAARKIGAALVSANIARLIREQFAAKPKDYHPFVYCWRGGERSASLATVLARIGWRVTVLDGGYRTYRAHVQSELDAVPTRLTFQILAGATGTGKTRLLHRLAERGAQVLDLEGLANHRGSILGSCGPQPAQRLFESSLLDHLGRFDPARPVWVEAESNKIGNRYLPKPLWDRLRGSDGVEIRVPLEDRVQFLIADYAHLQTDPVELQRTLQILARHRGAPLLKCWDTFVESRDWPSLVRSLLTAHYDPCYRASLSKQFPRLSSVIDVADLSEPAIELLVDRLLTLKSAAPFGDGTA